ncbi:GNAT family N-acetyltransferase [Streptomyces pinistramenti]|uniref:GNAT family N-acetyltransferase n=1 Tax=Streptomyces pinistramenti TaxID=2884812 RepID=UPI001D08D160|nr:GNAT family protein [Streptomyces pinistramenti]MCB5908011.1 GNAT family N-acetyltransferase [Streptomyces pinistramenti]
MTSEPSSGRDHGATAPTGAPAAPRVRLAPWPADGAALLRRLNSPRMTAYLGGPESAQRLVDRHRRYRDLSGPGRMYAIVLLPTGDVAGSIGFWEQAGQNGPVYETGWGVLPEFQGRGIAVAAARAVIDAARAEGRHRALHAFPAVCHAASNAVCRRAGFTLRGECTVEYPKGHALRAHDWRFDLGAAPPALPAREAGPG